MGVLLLICCIFSEHLFLGTPTEGCLWSLNLTQSTQDVNWTYIRRSEDVLDVFWMSYVRSIYVLCLLGRHYMNVKFWLFGGDSANFLLCFVKCERQKSIFFLPIRKDNSILLRVVDLFKFLKQVPLPTLAVVFFVVLKLSLSLNLVKNCFQVNWNV